MRYFYKRTAFEGHREDVYNCKHPRYNRCSLLKIANGKGLAIVQMRFNPITKYIWWSEVDPDLIRDIANHPDMGKYLIKNAEAPNENGLYPTINVRKVMWALRMKPLPRLEWENEF